MPDQLARLKEALGGRYALQRELGRGGMATVYLAEDLKHHRPVAVKVLKPELAAALGPDRFLREIEIAAKLTHPHILPLYDSGRTGGRIDGSTGGGADEPAESSAIGYRPSAEFLYYVMPYVEGESLRDRLSRETQLPLDEALQIAREVADALSYAHSRDVIHRDIKPENILLQSLPPPPEVSPIIPVYSVTYLPGCSDRGDQCFCIQVPSTQTSTIPRQLSNAAWCDRRPSSQVIAVAAVPTIAMACNALPRRLAHTSAVPIREDEVMGVSGAGWCRLTPEFSCGRSTTIAA